MADVIDLPPETLDRRRATAGRRSGTPEDEDEGGGSPPPPPPPLLPQPPTEQQRKRERDPQDGGSRSRSPPLPPPPPPPGGPPGRTAVGDRDRDYRRRSSPSSPSRDNYRHRRHSPPRRSPSPGAYKRSRRDDGWYDRRRGSPKGGRGGYWNDDRRYGYDGFDRGNRDGGYGNERLYGRYGNRSSDWPDTGHGSAGEGLGATRREGLMTYKQFIQVLEDDVLPAEAERRYQEYRTEYITTQKRAYFNLHKDENWLKDKYHPTNLVSVIERRNENAKTVAKDFFLDLQSGTLDLGPGLTAFVASGNASDGNSDDEPDSGSKRRRHVRGPMKESSNTHSSAPHAHAVSCELRRVQLDIEQAQRLVHKLDIEKGIEGNILSGGDHDKDGEKSHVGSMGPIIIIRGLTTVKGLEGVELLDTLLTYLWRVHGIDYYGMVEMSEPKGLRHVRADSKSNTSNIEGSNPRSEEWEKKLDAFWQERLGGQDPFVALASKDKIDAVASEVLDPYVRKIRDEKYGWKYGCGAKGCTKLFHAPEFVHKHLKLKHADLVVELTSKVRDDLYFQNYMNDPNAPGGTPVMQQSALPKARQKLPMDNRLRDDRGSRRGEYDRSERDGERLGKPENSPKADANRDGDELMYDAYGGSGSAPFISEFPPPPMLVPLPGAGPLGPFIPAPPEMAMRMMREQAPPVEAFGGGGGRGGPPPIPWMDNSAPILPMPRDPRRIRSYHDLDAPEDEVTVIDYRSL